MYYNVQDPAKREDYKNMLRVLGELSRLFSVAKEPYLYYRAHENVFAKYFGIENNGRHDDSVDVCDMPNRIGLGLKTWVGSNTQKVAEFGKLRPTYANLDDDELVATIAGYRNSRIETTKSLHGLDQMFYHVVKRIPGAMQIYESPYNLINIDNIVINKDRGSRNTVYFSDGLHSYCFSKSKNTLYMVFDDLKKLDEFEVQIFDDPFALLAKIADPQEQRELLQYKINPSEAFHADAPTLCLRLYTMKKGKKVVAEHSGLNQWNGVRTKYRTDPKTGKREQAGASQRDPNELYIPFPAEDRKRNPDFFPPKDVSFNLKLPNGIYIDAKICQANGKAIMSKPNNLLGEWLLRGVLKLKEGELVTYETLEIHGIDSVIFTKLSDTDYSVDFCKLGTYEEFYGLADTDSAEEE